jgi:zinc and cadmium transporter
MDVTLLWIVGAALVGGALSLLLAGLLAFTVFSAWIPRMVSYAVGALLAAAFLDVLPEAIEKSGNVEMVSTVTLFGVLSFFLLEKAALWRHRHEDGDAHPHAHIGARTGMMILVGDAFHNFVDGVTIAAAFLADAKLGIATMVAVAAHEIPQELGDFVVLLNSGYTRSRALLLNLLSSLASVAGGIIGYLLLTGTQAVIPYILATAAASFIYIAVADLIPHLHRVTDARSTAWQVTLVAAGVATISVTDLLLH